jgi:hypothetical protein
MEEVPRRRAGAAVAAASGVAKKLEVSIAAHPCGMRFLMTKTGTSLYIGITSGRFRPGFV